jgi:hypothetical protein
MIPVPPYKRVDTPDTNDRGIVVARKRRGFHEGTRRTEDKKRKARDRKPTILLSVLTLCLNLGLRKRAIGSGLPFAILA